MNIMAGGMEKEPVTIKDLQKEDRHFLEKVKDILTDSKNVKGGLKASRGPAHILEHVFLGSRNDAENLTLLSRNKINYVLNCAAVPRYDGTPLHPYDGTNIKYLGIEARDNEDYPILMHFNQARNFIDTCYRRGGRVLIHCEMGVNRSGALCVAYLMLHERVTLLQALRRVKYERPVLLCNDGFQRQLISFARDKQLLHRSRADEDD